MYKTIYIEYVFIDNFIMNLLIIQLSSHICGLKKKSWRAAVSAGLGALYAVCILMPGLSWLYALPLKILLSFMMAVLAWGYGGLKKYMLRTAAFIGTTFLFGGAAIGLAFGFNGSVSNGVVYFNGFSYRLLAISCMLSVILARMVRESLRNTKLKEGLLYQLKVTFKDRNTVIDAYLDTGNMLYDIYSGAPVIIINYKSINHILPHELSIDLLTKRIDKTIQSRNISKFHYLPYKTVGKEGFLLGVRPDSIEVLRDNTWTQVDAILGISKTGLNDGIEALLHPILLQAS